MLTLERSALFGLLHLFVYASQPCSLLPQYTAERVMPTMHNILKANSQSLTTVAVHRAHTISEGKVNQTSMWLPPLPTVLSHLPSESSCKPCAAANQIFSQGGGWL
jgi:hypothetical protein